MKTSGPDGFGGTCRVQLRSTSEAMTAHLGTDLADVLKPGDTVLLSGPVGAGKSALARAIIQAAQRRAGCVVEDVPSPSFTLVQTYWAGGGDIWHCDLYRLTDADELAELGVDEAMATAIVLVEWPDLLRSQTARRYMEVTLEPDEQAAEVRRIDVSIAGPGWHHIAPVLERWAGAHSDA